MNILSPKYTGSLPKVHGLSPQNTRGSLPKVHGLSPQSTRGSLPKVHGALSPKYTGLSPQSTHHTEGPSSRFRDDRYQAVWGPQACIRYDWRTWLMAWCIGIVIEQADRLWGPTYAYSRALHWEIRIGNVRMEVHQCAGVRYTGQRDSCMSRGTTPSSVAYLARVTYANTMHVRLPHGGARAT